MNSTFAVCYETYGNPDNPCIILITGIGGQLIQWSEEFIDGLVENHLYVAL
jgi:proline iminopeptidase